MYKETKNNVVIIDQDEDLCQRFKQELEEMEEFSCSGTANDGQSGLELIYENKPDYIIMDLILPHLDGVSVLDELEEDKLIEDLNILVLSSFLNEKMLKILQNYQIDYFMSKPADFKCVKDRIKDLESDYTTKKFTGGYIKETREESNSLEINQDITNLLDNFGMPANIRGYKFLRNAIYLSVVKVDLINSITKKLYPKIAENFNTEASRVERAIRHAIKVAWERGNQKMLDDYFGYSISETIGRPTNAQFIAKVADNFRLKNNLITN
ncbi:MAG: sporulation transcription factor Spo0A [Bacillota bacterium]